MSDSITLEKWENKVIADGIKISDEKINKNQVKPGIKAPESMKVDRIEYVVFCFGRSRNMANRMKRI